MSSWESTKSVGTVTHMIDDVKNLVSSPSCTRKRLNVRRGLAKAECSNYDSKKNLNREQKMWLFLWLWRCWQFSRLYSDISFHKTLHFYLYHVMQSCSVHNLKWKLSLTGLLISDTTNKIIIVIMINSDWLSFMIHRFNSQVTEYIKPCTHCQKCSYVILSSENQCAAIPEGQRVGHIDHEVCESHSDIYCNSFLYTNILGIFQVFLIPIKKSELVK